MTPAGVGLRPRRVRITAGAVQVRSEGDYGAAAGRELTAQREDYFAAGTLVVWDVDVLRAEPFASFAPAIR